MITSDKTRNPYTLNGSATHFAYEFKIFSATDLEITKRKLDGSEQTINYPADCSITGAGTENGGEVVLNSPGTNGEILVIRRKLPKTQPFGFRNQPAFYGERHEDSLDRVVMLLQQISEETSRSIQLPVTFTGTAELDTLVDGQCVGVVANGDGSFRLTMVANSGAQQTADLANTASTTKGSGMVGHNDSLSYTAGTVGAFLNKFKDYANALYGAGMSGFAYALAYGANTVGKAIKDVMDRCTAIEMGGLGQCRFDYVSASTARLTRKGGKWLTIGGINQAIPVAGVDLSSTGLATGTLLYVYAYMNGVTMTLEAVATAHATDATTGVEIKSGDATRTLVGAVYLKTANTFLFSTTQRLVASWFNRKRTGLAAYASTSRGTATSATYAEFNTEMRIEFISWGDESVQVGTAGSMSTNTAGTSAVGLGIDSTTAAYSGTSQSGTSNSSGWALPFGATISPALSEGYHYATLLGQALAGYTVTVISGNGTHASLMI